MGCFSFGFIGWEKKQNEDKGIKGRHMQLEARPLEWSYQKNIKLTGPKVESGAGFRSLTI